MEYGILEQISMTFNSKNRLVQWICKFIIAWFPTIIGGFAPIATFSVSHYGKHIQGYQFAVAAGLTYSALTVFKWLKSALKTRGASEWETNLKAAGFVGLIETVMILCNGDVLFLAYLALGILVFINGVANGCSLMLESQEKREVREELAKVAENKIRQEVFNEIEEAKRIKREAVARKRKASIKKKAA